MIKSLIRPANLIHAGYSFIRSSVNGSPNIKGMPVSVSTELTNNCNLKCPHCASGSGIMDRKRGFMDLELFTRLMRELNPYLYNINLYFQGEPMMHPMFFSFVEKCNVPGVVVSTNGHFLTEENSERIVNSNISRLIISLDGINQENYSAYRVNGNMNKVIDGIKNITQAIGKYHSSLKTEIQFLVNRFNEKDIPELKILTKNLHIPLRLKSMQIIIHDDMETWLPSDKRFRRYELRDGVYQIKNSFPDRCGRLWFNPVVTWDGKVVPCCFDKNAEYVMGDLRYDSFREIWDGPKYRIFRRSILTGRNMIEMCRNCTSGLKGVRY